MPLAALEAAALTRGRNLCRTRALDWSDTALELGHERLCQARNTRDQDGIATTASHLADIHTARADFARAASLRREAATASPTPERTAAASLATKRSAIYSADADFRQWADTNDVLSRATRQGKQGPREDDLVVLLCEVQRTRSSQVLNAAASAARSCGETALAFGLLDRALALEPEVGDNPAAFVVTAALLNDEHDYVFARDLLVEVECVEPDNAFMHRTAMVTWRALENRDEYARHAAALKDLR